MRFINAKRFVYIITILGIAFAILFALRGQLS